MARILVVDDEEPMRRMLRRALTAEGHDIVEARDGKEALRLLQTGLADLVITDIIMPERDGLELITTLRRTAPQLKVIAFSGGGRFKQKEPLEAAELLGAYATIEKPFELDTLLAIVQTALAA